MNKTRNRQLPGRQQALRQALGKQASPLIRHIAGLDRVIHRKPSPMPETFTFSSGIESIPAHERAALPF